MTGAWIDGTILHVPNAKRQAGRASARRIDLSAWHPSYIAALQTLIDIVGVDVEAIGYDRWLGNLAEILARACTAASSRSDHRSPRLAPSSFRHTSISTWHAAGYTVEEIAELAGHLNLRSQLEYRHSKAAWAPREMVKPLEPARIDMPRPAATSAENLRSSGEPPTSRLRRCRPEPDRDTQVWANYARGLESNLDEIDRQRLKNKGSRAPSEGRHDPSTPKKSR